MQAKPDPNRWLQLWQAAALQGDAHARHSELVELYSQPHRHYHNLRHIGECLTEFDFVRELAHQPVAVELAIWFHDAVYDPHAYDNEERSAELAKTWLGQAGGSMDLCNSVSTLIMATKTHDPNSHPDAPLLVDVDLSILGQPKHRFEEYEHQIRLEYAWVPEQLFAAKRSEILERFLARERIYATPYFFDKYERSARHNLEQSIAALWSSFGGGA